MQNLVVSQESPNSPCQSAGFFLGIETREILSQSAISENIPITGNLKNDIRYESPNHPPTKIPEIGLEPPNRFKSELLILPTLTGAEKLAYSTSSEKPNFFVLDEKGNLCQWNMNSRHKVFNWRGIVSPGNIFHFIISGDKKNIYIVWSKDGGMYLSKFDIETRS